MVLQIDLRSVQAVIVMSSLTGSMRKSQKLYGSKVIKRFFHTVMSTPMFISDIP